MAHHLGMNYLFAVEFVELTLGTKEEHHGLHGNAFLTKCRISDSKISRDSIVKYFDHKANGVNAGG